MFTYCVNVAKNDLSKVNIQISVRRHPFEITFSVQMRMSKFHEGYTSVCPEIQTFVEPWSDFQSDLFWNAQLQKF